jgi:hypothetical protein
MTGTVLLLLVIPLGNSLAVPAVVGFPAVADVPAVAGGPVIVLY